MKYDAMSAAQLADLLIAGAEGLHPSRQAAVHLVVRACDGDLVDLGGVRAAVREHDGGTARINWAGLTAVVADCPTSGAGDAILRLACALGDNGPLPALGSDLGRLDPRQKAVVAQAFAVAAGLAVVGQ